jgi:molybdate transport system ATP-binding protein
MIDFDIQKELHGANGKMHLDIQLTIKEGEFLVITGKSGSGKSTLLRILAGLEKANGTIKVNDELWLDNTKSMAIQKRQIGFVFQDYALFENMTVLENLLYVKKNLALANELLNMTELEGLKNRRPNSLSGGQKQRVSLCRAMMNQPKILFLDEALSALDSDMRKKLQNDIVALHKRFNTTTIMISHDYSEIYKLSSRLVILEQGKVVQDDTAHNILMLDKKEAKSFLQSEILEVKENTAIVLFNDKILEITISDEKKKDIKIGQMIGINLESLKIS